MSEVKKLTADDAAADDLFGDSVAISGDTIVVGAVTDDATDTDSGSAYVFVRIGSGWSQQAKLVPGDAAAGDLFGDAVAISGDTIVVGSVLDDDAGANSDSGSAYVFVRSGTTWSQQAKLTASDDAAGDLFGTSLVISGETIVIGAPHHDDAGADSGSVYVFVRSGTTWSQQAKLSASNAAAGDRFGTSVAVSGNTIVTGASHDDDGGTDSGSAYVFVRSGTSWSQQTKLTASDAVEGDRFSAVTISGDTIVVGALLDDDAGTDSGSAYVFVRSGTNWSQQAKLTAGDAAAGDHFGGPAISGNTVVIGARLDDDAGTDSGSAYVFARSGTSWSQQTKLTAGDAAAGDNFGGRVAISGGISVVSARLDDDGGSDSGSAYVFAGVPTAPTNVTAVGGNALATVSWTAPASDGGATITQYTVTSSPGGFTASTTGTSVTVTGLDNGTTYTFTVTATNSLGTSTASVASNSVTPAAPSAPGLVLADLQAPSVLNLQVSQVIGLSVLPVNGDGNTDIELPNVTYAWTAGSCGSLDDVTSRTPTFTANSSACTGAITVHANQSGGPNVPSTDRSISVNVAALPPTPVPTAVPTDPAVITEIVPAGLSADDVAMILPSSGGMFSVPQEAGDDAPPISIEIPGGALDSGTTAAVTINVVSVRDVAPPPAGATEGATSGTFRFGDTIIEVQWYDDAGNALDTFRLNRPAEICVPYSQADINSAAGGPDGMAVWRFNGTEWVQLKARSTRATGRFVRGPWISPSSRSAWLWPHPMPLGQRCRPRVTTHRAWTQ